MYSGKPEDYEMGETIGGFALREMDHAIGKPD